MDLATLMRMARTALAVGAVTFALPISCSQQGGDGIYSGGIQPSPSGRTTPFDPRFVNGE